MNKKDDLQQKADAFYQALQKSDIDRLRKRFTVIVVFALVMMFFISLVSILFGYATTNRPTPVIAFDKTGRSLVFGNTSQEGTTTDPRINTFITKFIRLYDGISPHPDEDVTEAYNDMVPKLREILLAQGAHAAKVAEWKGKNIESIFTIKKMELKGPRTIGGKLAIIGTGTFTFRPAVAAQYNDQNSFSRFVFFKMQLVILPVTLQTPSGLLVEYYSSQLFDDAQRLKAFLLENNIPLTDDVEVAK